MHQPVAAYVDLMYFTGYRDVSAVLRSHKKKSITPQAGDTHESSPRARNLSGTRSLSSRSPASLPSEAVDQPAMQGRTRMV